MTTPLRERECVCTGQRGRPARSTLLDARADDWSSIVALQPHDAMRDAIQWYIEMHDTQVGQRQRHQGTGGEVVALRLDGDRVVATWQCELGTTLVVLATAAQSRIVVGPIRTGFGMSPH